MSLDQLPSVLIALLMHGLPTCARFTFARSCKRTYAAADCAFAFKHANPVQWAMRRSSPSIVQRRFLRHLPALRVDWLDNTFTAEECDVDVLLELSAVVLITELRLLPTRVISTALLHCQLQDPNLQRLRVLSLRTLPDDQTNLVSALPLLEKLDLLLVTRPFSGFTSLTPSLTSLSACGRDNLLSSLEHCPRLLSLSVHWPALNDGRLLQFSHQSVVRQLRFISFVHLGNVLDDLIPPKHWAQFFENARDLHTFEIGEWPDCSGMLVAIHRAPALRLLRIRKNVEWLASDLLVVLLDAPSLRVELADLRVPWPSAPAQERKKWKQTQADVATLNAATNGRVTMVFQA